LYFCTDNLLAVLDGSGVVCRRIDSAFLKVYLDYFVAIGYLMSAPMQAENPA